VMLSELGAVVLCYPVQCLRCGGLCYQRWVCWIAVWSVKGCVGMLCGQRRGVMECCVVSEGV